MKYEEHYKTAVGLHHIKDTLLVCIPVLARGYGKSSLEVKHAKAMLRELLRLTNILDDNLTKEYNTEDDLYYRSFKDK